MRRATTTLLFHLSAAICAANLATTPVAAQATFGCPDLFPAAPTYVADIATGDVDGDGDTDVVACAPLPASPVITPNPGTFVYLNDGSGQFPGGTIQVSVQPTRTVGLGDLDGINGADLVAVENGRLDVFFNTGTGFPSAPSVTIAPPAGIPGTVVLEDMDGDGDLDVVVGHIAGVLHVFLWDGATSNLGPAVVSVTGSAFTSWVFADVDGDTLPDAILADAFNDHVAVHPNTSATTPGTFGSGQIYLAASPIVWAVQALDLEPDGDTDIVVGRGGDAQLLVNDGTGSFTPGATIAAASSAEPIGRLAVDDLDQDGDDDALCNWVLSPIAFGLLDNTGGALAAPNALAASGLIFTTADVNGDAFPEILYWDVHLHVARNTTGSPGCPIGAPGNGPSFGFANRFFGGTRLWDIDIGDLDGDGQTDIVACDFGRSGAPNDPPVPGDLLLFWGDGTGQFTKTARAYPSPGVRRVQVADLNADGGGDIVVWFHDRLDVYLNNGTRTITTPFFSIAGLPTLSPIETMDAIDADGNGSVDVAIGLHAGELLVFLGNGDGTLNAPVLTTTGGSDKSWDFADIDGDGLPDAIAVNPATDDVEIYRNDPAVSGGFALPATVHSLPSDIVDAAPFDCDGDGDPDILVSRSSGVRYLRNVGGMLFDSPVTAIGLQGYRDNDLQNLVAGDFDQDSDGDFLFYGSPVGAFKVIDTARATASLWLRGPTATTSTGRLGRIGDLDGDGLPDLVFASGFDVAVALNTSGLRGMATSVDGGPYDVLDKILPLDGMIHVVRFGTDVSGNPALAGLPALILINFEPEASSTAWTPMTNGQPWPQMSVVSPFSTPPGFALSLAASMGDPPLQLSVSFTGLLSPGDVIRMQAVYFDPNNANPLTFGLTATNQVRLIGR